VQNLRRIYALSKRNIILRYKNSLAGFFWGFFKPLLYLLIYTAIFSRIPSNTIERYTLYVTSGLIFWFFFSNVTNQSAGSIIGSSGLIKSLNIPTIFFPLSELLGELFNFVLTVFVFLILMYWFGLAYSFKLLLLLPCLLLFSIFSLGVSIFLAALNVFFRDVGIIWNTVQPALFYLTPIGYPEKWVAPLIMQFNPIYYFIKLGRSVIYDVAMPAPELWLSCLLIAGGMFLLGIFVFIKLKNQFIAAI
jgi:ABC-2 type transport system permease protein